MKRPQSGYFPRHETSLVTIRPLSRYAPRHETSPVTHNKFPISRFNCPMAALVWPLLIPMILPQLPLLPPLCRRWAALHPACHHPVPPPLQADCSPPPAGWRPPRRPPAHLGPTSLKKVCNQYNLIKCLNKHALLKKSEKENLWNEQRLRKNQRTFSFYVVKWLVLTIILYLAVLRDASGGGGGAGGERKAIPGIKYGRMRRPAKFSRRRRKKSKSTDTDSSSRYFLLS